MTGLLYTYKYWYNIISIVFQLLLRGGGWSSSGKLRRHWWTDRLYIGNLLKSVTYLLELNITRITTSYQDSLLSSRKPLGCFVIILQRKKNNHIVYTSREPDANFVIFVQTCVFLQFQSTKYRSELIWKIKR